MNYNDTVIKIYQYGSDSGKNLNFYRHCYEDRAEIGTWVKDCEGSLGVL